MNEPKVDERRNDAPVDDSLGPRVVDLGGTGSARAVVVISKRAGVGVGGSDAPRALAR